MSISLVSHMTYDTQSLNCIHVADREKFLTSFITTRPLDKSGPIRGQYSGHVICLNQSEASFAVQETALL